MWNGQHPTEMGRCDLLNEWQSSALPQCALHIYLHVYNYCNVISCYPAHAGHEDVLPSDWEGPKGEGEGTRCVCVSVHGGGMCVFEEVLSAF